MPNECRELGEVVAREHGNVHRSGEFGAAGAACACSNAATRCAAGSASPTCCWPASAMRAGGSGSSEQPYPQRERLLAALAAALAVDTTALAAEAADRGLTGPAIGERIRAAREQAIADALFPARK